MRMKTCPRCESSIDDAARFCVQCGAPQTEDAAEDLDEYVQKQADRVAADSGTFGGGQGGGGQHGGDDTSENGADGNDWNELFGVALEELSDRERLWRRGCYVLGYGTVVVALTRITSPGAWFLLLGGIAILPPMRRLLGRPLGSPFKREVMAGLYGLFVLLGVGLFAFL